MCGMRSQIEIGNSGTGVEGAWTCIAIKQDREALPYDASIEMQVQCTLQVEHIYQNVSYKDEMNVE